MRNRERGLLLLAGALLILSPLVSADNDLASSELMTDGQSVNGNVDYDSDGTDWWKIYTYTGDALQVSVSTSSTGWDGGYEGNVKLTDAAGNTLAGENALSDAASSTSLSTTVSSEGWVHLRIKSTDSWFADGFDYSLSPLINKDNRDTDADGFIDNEDSCKTVIGSSTNDRNGCPDSDSDGWSDPDMGWGVMNGADAFKDEPSQHLDTDNDGYGNDIAGFQGDHCPFKRGYSFSDRYGCLDTDGDSWSDPDPGGLDGVEPWHAHPVGFGDAFHQDSTQWNDTDHDGFGDNWADGSINLTREEWAIGQWYYNATTPDSCPFITGYSNQDRYGCTDSDSDGWSDEDLNWTVGNGADAFPEIPSQWSDDDLDGWGDNQTEGAERVDDFPANPTQWRDSDGDGWGDNQTFGATQVDAFPGIPGSSTPCNIVNECATQWSDQDRDGFGDNPDGFRADKCRNSSAEEVDNGWISLGFGFGGDRWGCLDSDKDGYSDPDFQWAAHPGGLADAFPQDPSQWMDSDGDGFGDNLEYFDGNSMREAWRGDGCPSNYGNSTFDRWGCLDTDGDGWSNPTGFWLASPAGSGDAWQDDPTQWHDTDGDDKGDNPTGTEADVCPETPGKSLGSTHGGDRWGCPDTDGDGWSDLGDRFMHEPTQWRDTDGDGFGDNISGHEGDACPNERGSSLFDRLGCRDSDGDGWSDFDEEWLASPWGLGDAFPNDRFQWSDQDEDGFGDNPMGAARDDCPEIFGTSYRDLQGCPDLDGDGWSDDYGGFKAAIATLGEDPAASWLTYAILGAAFMIGGLFAAVVRLLRDGTSYEEEKYSNQSVAEAVYQQPTVMHEDSSNTVNTIVDDLFKGGGDYA